MYISLFHGRKYPYQELRDYGEQGPIIGPVNVSWTYNGIKLHDKDWEDMEPLTVFEDMVVFRGMYYGDFEIWNEGDRLLSESIDRGREIIAFEEFVNETRSNHHVPPSIHIERVVNPDGSYYYELRDNSGDLVEGGIGTFGHALELLRCYQPESIT